MRFARFRHLQVLSLLGLTLVSGCNYVHFGRINRTPPDPVLVATNADLTLENKLLQQELSIARKEGEALRAALDKRGSGGDAEALVAKLNEATRELTALRGDYARLQAQRQRLAGDQPGADAAAVEQIAALKSELGQTEEKLALSLRNFTQLQEDNNRLRSAIDEAHLENATLTTRMERVSAQNAEARSALAQLNTELLAQKEARAQAEQSAEALRTQLHAMASQSSSEPSNTLASARESTASGARAIESTLQINESTSGPVTAATLSVNPEKLRNAAAAAKVAEEESAAPAAKSNGRRYTVRDGDTLEKIAAQFYGRPERWSVLYTANNALLSGGRPLKAGMELEIPDDK